MVKQVICALDTADIQEATRIVTRLKDHVGAFKIGHALTLSHGLDIVNRLQDAGATRIFLDLKFHDIPNSVAVAVREAAKRDVWMLTVHTSGGPAMLNAAVEEARNSPGTPPLIVGVSVLTSLDQHILSDHLGVNRSLEDQMVHLSKLAADMDLDGVVCSPHEIKAVRAGVGKSVCIIVPGIRLPGADTHDQKRAGDARQALEDGADYLVIGRALTDSPDPAAALAGFNLAHSH